jgi:hypothetical protein
LLDLHWRTSTTQDLLEWDCVQVEGRLRQFNSEFYCYFISSSLTFFVVISVEENRHFLELELTKPHFSLVVDMFWKERPQVSSTSLDNLFGFKRFSRVFFKLNAEVHSSDLKQTDWSSETLVDIL